MTADLVSGLHLTCTNATDHGGVRRDRHRRYLLIAVFALSITASRAKGNLLYRQRSRDLWGGSETEGRAEGEISGEMALRRCQPRGLVTYPLTSATVVCDARPG
jgi:hypothetical protein